MKRGLECGKGSILVDQRAKGPGGVQSADGAEVFMKAGNSTGKVEEGVQSGIVAIGNWK